MIIKHTTIARILACLFTFQLAAVAAPAAGSAGPLKVFLLSGQSNMTGRGVVASIDHKGERLPLEKQQATLFGFVNQPDNRDRYSFLREGEKRTDDGWTIRDDVYITTGEWPHRKPGEEGYDATRKHGGLAPGYGGRRGRGFGPELAIGHLLGEHYEQPVLLIKVAFGGNSLAKNFRPPSSDGETGDKYIKLLQGYREALAHLPEIIPDYDPEQGYELVGFFWNQGLSDLSTSRSQEYESNLTHLIHDLRRDLKTPDLKTVVAVTGNWGWGTKHYKAHLEDYAAGRGVPLDQFMKERGQEFLDSMEAIRQAQVAVPKRAEFKGSVATAETRDFWRPREQHGGHGTWSHWNANAESYWRIGESMGQSMIQLLKQQVSTPSK